MFCVMIDFSSEAKLSLAEAARLPELRIDDRPASLRGLWRRVLRGELETLKIGGRRVTSREAVRRMLARQNPGPFPQDSGKRDQEIRAAAARLEEAGF